MNVERHYEHRFHAGNVGDVWKHAALIALLEKMKPALYVETHAGAGCYVLGATGEWTEGVGLLASPGSRLEESSSLAHGVMPGVVSRYLAIVQAASAGARSVYPGSPLIAHQVLPPESKLRLFELDRAVYGELATAMRAAGAEEPRAELEERDGLSAIAEAVRDDALVLIDPPYADRREWELAPDALLRAQTRAPGACCVLWYPIKSYARPNAMHARLEKAGLSASAIELLTSPMSSKKNRLNGSGLLITQPPPGMIETLAHLATWLGPRLALPVPPHRAFWHVRALGF